MRIATFTHNGQTQVGLVNADQTHVTVLDLPAAERALAPCP